MNIHEKESDLTYNAATHSQQTRLSDYRVRLGSDYHKVIFDDRVESICLRYAKPNVHFGEVRAYLNQLKDSEGPFCRSFKSYDKMKAVVESFSAPERGNFGWSRNFRYAFERVAKRYREAHRNAIRYQTNHDIYEQVSGYDTSTGYYYIESGVRHKCDIDRDTILDTFKEKVGSAIAKGTFGVPCLASYRCQASGEFEEDGTKTNQFSRKTRLVWMMYVWTVLAEKRFSEPLNGWLKFYPYSIIGKDDKQIWHGVETLRHRFDRWVSIDYSKYDSTIPSWLIHYAFQILAMAFDNLTDDDRKLLGVLEHDFIHKKLLMARATEDVEVHHGDPSGSGLTAIINGICNELITETWAKYLGREVKFMIMGDDNLIYYYGDKIDVSAVKSYVEHNFGVIIHDDAKLAEGESSDDPFFLSRFWRGDGPWRHPNILISKMLFPERFRNYSNPKAPLTPEVVFYSYVLGYKAAMYQAFDVDQFLVDTDIRTKMDEVEYDVLQYLPYNVRLSKEIAKNSN